MNNERQNFTEQFYKMLLPAEWFDIFDLAEVEEKIMEWNIVLVEKETLVPNVLQHESYALNGYCKPIELMNFPAKGKPVYVIIKRRKWKKQGDTESYFNTYDLHYPGVKATKPFADFLKELDRDALDEFLNAWPVYRRVWEKDTSLVSRLFKWISRR